MPGKGEIDWTEFIDTLRSIGYDDVISIEHEDPEYEGSIEQIKEGLTLGREHLAESAERRSPPADPPSSIPHHTRFTSPEAQRSMRQLLSSDYFPYGSQYYRAPSPGPDDWERDLERMKELGFNSIKYWAQWRWNHPAEDEFYWDDLDRLMDLADKHGLRVMLNTIVDVAPAWIYTKYPDASMLTLSGRRIGPQTQPHRQIGGLGVCLNHREVMDHMFRFLEACWSGTAITRRSSSGTSAVSPNSRRAWPRCGSGPTTPRKWATCCASAIIARLHFADG
jgi:hypothetical protein